MKLIQLYHIKIILLPLCVGQVRIKTLRYVKKRLVFKRISKSTNSTLLLKINYDGNNEETFENEDKGKDNENSLLTKGTKRWEFTKTKSQDILLQFQDLSTAITTLVLTPIYLSTQTYTSN